MASEQAHGNAFERIVVAHSGLQLAGAPGSVPTAVHDIPMESTRDAVPISVKTVQCDLNHPGARPVVALGDAARFYTTTTSEALRVVVGLHHATALGPLIYEIHECLVVPQMQAGLWGELQDTDIRAFAAQIKTWAAEDDASGIVGRKRASENALKMKRAMLPRMGHVDLNPKISANEARLQCSVPLYGLRRECINAGSHAAITSVLLGASSWKGIPLPLQLEAGNRSKSKADGAEPPKLQR